MIHVRVEAVKNISSAVEEKLFKKRKRGERVVELDQLKSNLNAYEEPLAEMRDSL